jgi:uncharacterized protein YbjT (DUF2867 family)
MYAIIGATGNTGKPITLSILNAGKKVRIISRRADKVKELTEKGAELFMGDVGDAKFLSKAFHDTTAVYAMIPPDITAPDVTKYQTKIADSIAQALQTAGVKFVVALSSIGTHLEKDAGIVTGLRYMEQKLNAIPGLNTLYLRPTYFMENSLGMVDVVKNLGIMGSPVKADLKINMIATKDIAAYAAKRLLALDFTGHNIKYLLGQRDLTYSDVARVFGMAIGKPDLRYVEFPFEEFKKALLNMGASASMADNMNTFIKSMNEGKVLSDAKRTPDTTTPTSIEDFAKTFADIYSMRKT